MKYRRTFAAGIAALGLMASQLIAGEILIEDAYARTSTPSSKTGAAFMVIRNTGSEADRLIAAETDVAARAELHTHKEDANGVMRMMEVEGGIPVPGEGMHHLRRGGDHIMLMGLSRALEQGEMLDVTLTFEKAGEITLQIPVDRERKPDHGRMDHSNDG